MKQDSNTKPMDSIYNEIGDKMPPPQAPACEWVGDKLSDPYYVSICTRGLRADDRANCQQVLGECGGTI